MTLTPSKQWGVCDNKPICMGYLSVWKTLQQVQDLLSELYFERMASEVEKHKVF